MTEIGGYASALALAVSGWGGFVALSPLWDRASFRAASRRAGAAAAGLLALALASLAWAAWMGDVRFPFVIAVAEIAGTAPARLSALLASPGSRFLVFLTLFAVFGFLACRAEPWGGLERRRWSLFHGIILAGILALIVFADPWSTRAAGRALLPPETLELEVLVSRSLRLAAVAAWAVVFVLVWSAVREIRERGALLRRPYLWGAGAWLLMTASILSDYAFAEGGAVGAEPLEMAAWRAGPAWLLGLGFLHAAGLARRRPVALALSLGLGVAVFPLAFPLVGDGILPWPWAMAGLAAAALALAAIGRAERALLAPRPVGLWTRDRAAVLAAGVVTAVAGLSLGALLAGGTLPGAVRGRVALFVAVLAAWSLAFPGIRGAARRIALRVAPSVAIAIAVGSAVAVLTRDAWFGAAAGVLALNLVAAAREILAARPGRSTLWLWGASLAHTGFAALVLGFAAARLGVERSVEVVPGDALAVRSPLTGPVEFRYLGLSLYAGGGAAKWAATVEVMGLGDGAVVARAEQRDLPGRAELYHVPGLVRALKGSAHIDLAEVLSVSAERVRLRVAVRPLATAVWLGFVLVMAGTACGLAAAVPRAVGAR